MNRIFTAALAASVAFPAAALAQSQSTQDDRQQAEACAELAAYIVANDIEGNGITTEEAGQVAANGDAQTCNDALRRARGEISAEEGVDTYDADAIARLRVVVPEPDVTVRQAAPQVTVDQQAPDVSVNPGQPVVTVNQAQPIVRVETTPPRVTIDMPKPEILVEMPDPTVDVAMRQPRVTVNQARPEVSVEQGEVRVQMGKETVADDTDTADADVQVEQDQAEVQVEQASRTRVQIGEVTPQVRYNAAEPKVEVSEAGEPDIRFNQSGEANVTFRQMTADETRKAAEEGRRRQQQAAATRQQTEQAGTGAGGDERMNLAVLRATAVDAEPKYATRKFKVESLYDMDVVGADGDELGGVEDVIVSGEKIYLIVGSGGFLGLGEKKVALPLDDMRLHDEDTLVLRAITEDDVERMKEVDPDAYQSVSMDQEVGLRVN